MFVVLHPADVDDRDPVSRNLLPFLCVVIILLLGVLISTKLAIALAILALAVVHLQRMRNARQWKGWESWPRVESTVEMVDVREVRKRRTRYYIGELAYSYKVQSEYYSGFCRCIFNTEKEAREFVDAFRGQQIPVRYKPETPDISIMSGNDLHLGNNDSTP
jgi:c-di-AMP phosphodiesterase-like protein